MRNLIFFLQLPLINGVEKCVRNFNTKKNKRRKIPSIKHLVAIGISRQLRSKALDESENVRRPADVAPQ